MTTFYGARNNVGTTTTGYTAGAGSIALAPGAGSSFGDPSPTAPIVISTFTAAGVAQGVYSCTGRTGDTLTGLTLLSGTDATLSSGALVRMRWTAEHVQQILQAILALEAAPPAHDHDDRYYTEDETDGLLAARQPGDATLTALAALDATAGLLEQTGADAFARRAIGVGSSASIPTRADADGRYDAAGSAATVLASLAAHEAAGDPHPQYLTPAEGGAAYAALGHGHAIGDVSGLQAALDSKGAGTVTSVALTVPGVIFSSPVAGSPITSSGTLALVLATQAVNAILAGPTSGGVATPTFRALVPADYPAMVGATSGVAGARGAVPAPAAGDQAKVLSGAGTWIAAGGLAIGTAVTGGGANRVLRQDSAGNFAAAAGVTITDGGTFAVSTLFTVTPGSSIAMTPASGFVVVTGNFQFPSTGGVYDGSVVRLMSFGASMVTIGVPSVATNAVSGYPYVSRMTGPPTGIPTAVTGMSPVVIEDSATPKIWVYANGGWKSAALT